MPEHGKEGKRRYMRFSPDEIEVALIQFTNRDPDEFFFEADAAGLVVEEAYGGCGLVVLSKTTPDSMKEGAACLVKVGHLAPVRGEVRWVKSLDQDVSKLGIEYQPDA
ncbi:MAG: hypothetical protein RQ741_06255 [Wenzhouxiangellaceae bacterium]|nr:hypothetical protein [Wenzhouxiangellaceae bacterium]